MDERIQGGRHESQEPREFSPEGADLPARARKRRRSEAEEFYSWLNAQNRLAILLTLGFGVFSFIYGVIALLLGYY